MGSVSAQNNRVAISLLLQGSWMNLVLFVYVSGLAPFETYAVSRTSSENKNGKIGIELNYKIPEILSRMLSF